MLAWVDRMDASYGREQRTIREHRRFNLLKTGMSKMEVKLFTVPWESLGDADKPDGTYRTDELLIHLKLPTDPRISEVEEAIIDALRAAHQPRYFHYNIESRGHRVQWGVSSVWHEVVAYIPPLMNSAVSGAVGALTYSIVQKIFERLSASSESCDFNQSSAIGLEACEVKALNYIRWKFGQEVAVCLVRATEDEDSRYAFQYECGDRRIEVITGRDGDVFGFRRL